MADVKRYDPISGEDWYASALRDNEHLRRENAELQRKLETAERALTAERDREAKEYPRVVVCAVILRDGCVLMEKRAPAGIEGLDNKWDLPGGKLECGETPEQAIVREIDEELGITISVKRLLPFIRTSTWDYPKIGRRHWLLIPYLCELQTGLPELSAALQWVPQDMDDWDLLEADRAIIAAARKESTDGKG